MANSSYATIIIIVLCVNNVFSKLKPIPDYLHICRRSNPDIPKCIIESAYSLRSKLAEGIPEFDVAPMDPMLINTLIPTNGNGLKIETTNLLVTGTSNFTITHLIADIDKQKYNFQVRFPHMHVMGNYSIDGQIARMVIKGRGDFDLDICKYTLRYFCNRFIIPLCEVLNLAINANFVMFFMELRPIIQKVLEEFVLDTVEKLTQHFTYEQLFPD
ncbi:hypothetical protein AGLY_005316 [Aphis glycines]|uniref:Uncharacterized protein n=1 Tax=Aphis glycines TaxID=307491 RepID=A0A6G0TWS2_APHGL|nr:hypothetical protein AGLY_005316 [Aphis glycines]